LLSFEPIFFYRRFLLLITMLSRAWASLVMQRRVVFTAEHKTKIMDYGLAITFA